MPKISLAAARINAGYTQDQVATILKVAPSTVRNWESGKTTPNLQKVSELCELYNMSYDYIDFVRNK